MIKKNDLRIGNVVTDLRFPAIISKVEQLHDEYLITSYSDSVSYEQIEGVWPTREILQSFGFVPQKLPANYANGNSGYKVCIMKSADRWLLYTKGLMSIMHGEDVYGSAPCGRCSTLHGIQNLFYCLTGEELVNKNRQHEFMGK